MRRHNNTTRGPQGTAGGLLLGVWLLLAAGACAGLLSTPSDLVSQKARLEEIGRGRIDWQDPRVELGRELFFEPRLSVDGTVACAHCHDVRHGFADPRSASVGVADRIGRRNAPTILNTGLLSVLFWDGRTAVLEEQAEQPITNPAEMGQPSRDAAVAALAAIPRYRRGFRQVYGREIQFKDMADALARFERSLIFLDAPVDRFLAGETQALSEEERSGHALFSGKALCTTCHRLSAAEPLGTDGLYHNLGVGTSAPAFTELVRQAALASRTVSLELVHPRALETDLSHLGRFAVTRDPADLGAFRTSPLRNVGLTAPYMHDGSQATLWDVVDFYNRGGEPNPYLDEAVLPLKLTEEEVDQLVAFLFTLTDRAFAEENRRESDRQRRLARR